MASGPPSQSNKSYQTPEEELLDTERIYVDSLKFLINFYVIPLELWLQILIKEFQQNGEDDTLLCSYLMNPQVNIIDGLFKNIKQILQFHMMILTEFEETHGNRVDMVKKLSYFDRGLLFYNDYIRNTEHARALLTALKTDIRFRSFLFAIELNPASLNLSLESQLSKPWQRVMKYTLLLREIYKRSIDNLEKTIVEKTIQQLEHTLEDLNKKQEDADLARIGKEKEKYYGITIAGPARRYVFDSKIKVITHNSKLSQSAILCTDVLLIGKKKGLFTSATFVEYNLRDVLIIRYPPLVSKFFMIRLSPDQVIQIELASPELCDLWIDKLTSILTSYDKFIRPGTCSSDNSQWSRMISVWEIITKTERALMTYILPSNAVNGKIIDHSEIMVYDGVSPIESYLRLDDLPPLTPPPLVHAYSRLENLTEPTSCDKYLFINGVLKVNEAFRKDILGALPPLPYSEQPLALLCSTEDVDLAYTAQCQSTGYQLQLSPSVVEAIESFQDPYYCTELRVKELELAANLDNLMSLFDQLEIPIGCLHKLKALKDHHIYILIDECSLMESPSPYSRADAHEVLRSRRNDDESDQLTYWEYCESLLHNFIDILCYVPMKSVRVAFSHSKDLGIYCDRANKIIPPKRFQEKFHTKISAAFVEIQRKLNSYPDSMLTPAMRYAFDRAQKEVDRTVLLVLSSGKSMNDGADMKALIAARPLPEKAPVIFLPIGDTATHSWMRGIDHNVPYVAEIKEYELEKVEVHDSQGPIFPYTRGVWYVTQLLAALNPSDLDLLDEGYPLTKYSLDTLLGRIHTPKEYEYYFVNYPLCHHYVDVYHRLLTEPVGIDKIPATNVPFPEDGNLLEHLQPITSSAWSTFIPYSPFDSSEQT